VSKATATAHPNIALVKYWGKRDEALILPHQSSLSVTLAPLEVTATVDFAARHDSVEINGAEAKGSERDRVLALIERVRDGRKAKVVTRGNFPAAAGLASSAAAFAALAVAARGAAGLKPDVRAASILARLGSGSACRSIQGGFCVWHKGERADGEDSFAEQIFPPSHWSALRLLVAIVSGEEKEVKSRDGMRHTVETSPYYPAWARLADEDVVRAKPLIATRDLRGLGDLAERNAWAMHATSMAAQPPLCYLKPATLQLIEAVRHARNDGAPIWFTLDAGPNPVLLTDATFESDAVALAKEAGAREVIHCTSGGDARLSNEHLF
jgi:diphosphomevalonate decarboxylase